MQSINHLEIILTEVTGGTRQFVKELTVIRYKNKSFVILKHFNREDTLKNVLHLGMI